MYKQLTSQQRSQIFALLQKEVKKKEIALIIVCSVSTVYREIKRNSTDRGNYLWDKAHAKALDRRRLTMSNRALDAMLVWRIKQMLNEQWSPEQIVGLLAKDGIKVSVQSVYNIINADTSGELRRNCRHLNFKRRPSPSRKPVKATNIAGRTSIHDRPAEADGKRFGDFEMDLIVDGQGHAILVLVERLTNFVMMEKKLPHGKKAGPVAKAVVRKLFAYRKCLKTITTDNWSEFAAHLDITAGLRRRGMDDVKVYFAAATAHGRKGPWSTRTSSSGSTSRKNQISTNSLTAMCATWRKN